MSIGGLPPLSPWNIKKRELGHLYEVPASKVKSAGLGICTCMFVCERDNG